MLRAFALCLFFAGTAAAEPIPGAGRVEGAPGAGTCSAILIAPDLILTAAHCIGDDPSGISFRLSGKGEELPYPVAKTAHHPFYEREQLRPNWKVRFDIRIARLTRKVPDWVASPIPVGAPAQAGERLFLVSWRRPDGPHARQRPCDVVDGMSGVVTLGCPVRGGESGAGVLRKTETGIELVAIVSSRATIKNQSVALGTDVDLRLQPLLDALD